MTSNKLFYQKIALMLLLTLAYSAITSFYVVFNNLYCKSFDLSNILEDDSPACMVIRYTTIFYYCVIFVFLFMTIIAAYIVKNTKVDNPYYHVQPKPTRSTVMVFVPVYSESKQALETTIDSVVNNDYPVDAKCMFIVVDGHKKGACNDDTTSNYSKQLMNVHESSNLSANPNYEVYVGEYKHVPFILLIKKHNKGKKDSFIQVLKTIVSGNGIVHSVPDLYSVDTELSIDNKSYSDVSIETLYMTICDAARWNTIDIASVDYILMLDTDTKVDASGLRLLVDYLDSHPFTAAVCGQTSVINKTDNILSISQTYEYYITHYTLKSLESVFGDVLVLSGCFSLYRRNILCNKELLNRYIQEDDSNIYKANLTKLGEDRLLTNLILTLFPMFNTKYIEQAHCYTDVPTKFTTLLCQRRRWTNSMIFCHLMLLTNVPKYNIPKRIRFVMILLFELWLTVSMPLLLIFGYYYAIKYLVVSIISNSHDTLTTVQTALFLLIPVVMCIILRNLRMIKYSICFLFVLPVFSIIAPLYSLYKVDNFAWGNTRMVIDSQPLKEVVVSLPPPPPPVFVRESLTRCQTR